MVLFSQWQFDVISSSKLNWKYLKHFHAMLIIILIPSMSVYTQLHRRIDGSTVQTLVFRGEREFRNSGISKFVTSFKCIYVIEIRKRMASMWERHNMSTENKCYSMFAMLTFTAILARVQTHTLTAQRQVFLMRQMECWLFAPSLSLAHAFVALSLCHFSLCMFAHCRINLTLYTGVL